MDSHMKYYYPLGHCTIPASGKSRFRPASGKFE